MTSSRSSRDPRTKGASRRAFLKAGAGWAAFGLCDACSSFVRKRDPDLVVQATTGELRVERAMLSGGSLAVEVVGRPDKVLLFTDADGVLRAVSMTCPHLGCDVAYVAPRDRIVCPCHHSEFDPLGRRLGGPARRPLQAYATRIEGDEIVVSLGNP